MIIKIFGKVDKRIYLVNQPMGWLQLVGSLKLQVSSAEYSLFYRALLQKRPIILRCLLIVATPYKSLKISWAYLGSRVVLEAHCLPYRETERQRDREAERQRDSGTERQRGRETERLRK